MKNRCIGIMLSAALGSCLLAGCGHMAARSFSSASPVFDPVAFFQGSVRSTGYFENRRGAPRQPIETRISGVLRDSVLYIEQDLIPEGGRKTHRSWQIRRIDAHRIDAKANDIPGTAHGALYGNYLTWSYHLALRPGNALYNVRMTQYMYLQEDRRSLIIRTVIRKAGVKVVQVNEIFRKLD